MEKHSWSYQTKIFNSKVDVATLTLSLFIFRSKRRKHAAWYAIQNVLGHCKTDKQYSTSNKHNHVDFISSYDNQLSFIVEPKYLSSCTISYLIYIYGTQLFSCVLISRQGRVFVNIPITSCQAFSAVCIYSIIYADTISVDFSPIDIAYRIWRLVTSCYFSDTKFLLLSYLIEDEGRHCMAWVHTICILKVLLASLLFIRCIFGALAFIGLVYKFIQSSHAT